LIEKKKDNPLRATNYVIKLYAVLRKQEYIYNENQSIILTPV